VPWLVEEEEIKAMGSPESDFPMAFLFQGHGKPHGFFTLGGKMQKTAPRFKEIPGVKKDPIYYLENWNNSEPIFLLESIEGFGRRARYSFLGINPMLIIKGRNEEGEIIEEGQKSRIKVENPLHLLRELTKPYEVRPEEDLPPFLGGWVGYLGYDAVRYFEDIPDPSPHECRMDDFLFFFMREILVFDHLEGRVGMISYLDKESFSERIMKLLHGRNHNPSYGMHRGTPERPMSNFSKEEFMEKVRIAKEYIKKGDAIQIVLSQRFSSSFKGNPVDLYKVLRRINPSPYMFYMQHEDFHLIGSSPEVLVKVIDGWVEERPIAGTRRRGRDEEEDEKLAQELLEDPKERAEHVMLVDLARNDLGKVCEYGSVRVNEFMTVERYSHVMHIVSNVRGKLRKDYDSFDVLQACFPAGTVTGAPKIRAMEIIAELEGVQRGPYAGAVGYFSLSGNMDTCIAIRSIVMKGEKIFIQAGAGIVADSNPEMEYQETINKAMALFQALDVGRIS